MSTSVEAAERVLADLKALDAGMTKLNASIAKTADALASLLDAMEEASEA